MKRFLCLVAVFVGAALEGPVFAVDNEEISIPDDGSKSVELPPHLLYGVITGEKQEHHKDNAKDIHEQSKRRPEMDSSGFYSDTFSNGFGDFYTMKRAHNSPKKRRPEMDSSGFYGDTFNSGFGDFYTMKRNQKRRPEMDASGFHGDTFHGGFGDFYTMKKRRPEMDASGFHGDAFSSGFGDFYTMKKRRPEMDSSGFYGDTFSNGFGDFYTMKKRRPEMDSSGFYGDTFNSGFGDFYTMKRDDANVVNAWRNYIKDRVEKKLKQLKKRRPEMDASGFHGNTFSGGFGDFYPMKRNSERN